MKCCEAVRRYSLQDSRWVLLNQLHDECSFGLGSRVVSRVTTIAMCQRRMKWQVLIAV
jgi:hypothetical protein